jgi:hypothetical protein
MKLNPKLTGGLAWAGLILILAVPGADMLTQQPADSANTMTTGVDPESTAVVAPVPAAAGEAEPAQVAGTDPVDGYLSSGKKLPSYISDAPAELAVTQPPATVRVVAPTGPAADEPKVATVPQVKPVVAAPAATDPVEVASVDAARPVLIAPQPYPADKRPIAPQVIVTQPSTVATTEAPLIIDEGQTARRDAAVAAVLDDEPVRLQEPSRSSARVVTEDELEEWDTGSLADYLERRGYMSEDDAQALNDEGEFDEDGFFLDDGPNASDGRRVVRRLPRRDDGFFLF